MTDLKYIILEKIKQNIVCEKLEVNNKSYLHKHHVQSPKNNNSHFEVIINSKELKTLNKIEAHQKIYTILKEEMANTIHSLEIKIN